MANRIREVLIHLGMLVVLATPHLQAAEAYGFGELKLGMPISEADALRTDDRIERCTKGSSALCLVRKDTAFSRKARIVATLDDAQQTLSSISIHIEDFSAKKGYPCSYVRGAVIKSVSDAYGKPTCDKFFIGCTWSLPDGVEIKTSTFCSGTDPSSGMVNVRFAQTAAAK